jgi:hypothetical protein
MKQRIAVLVIVAVGIATAAFAVRQERAPVALPAAADTGVVIVGGSFEPSGVAHVPNSNYLLFVDDGRPTEVLLMEVDSAGNQVGSADPIPLNADVTDMEGVTTDGKYFYVVGSQSKKRGFEGDGLVRFRFDPNGRRIENVERIQGLKAWLADHVPELAGTAAKVGDDVLNIEGLAWDAENRRLLLGLRAPQVGGDALILPVRLADPEAGFSTENLRFDGPSIRIGLGGAGVRSIEYDASRRVFQIIAGAGLNAETLDFQVFEWSGKSGAPARSTASFSKTLKPEGFTRATIGGRSVAVIVFDVGRFTLRD